MVFYFALFLAGLFVPLPFLNEASTATNAIDTGLLNATNVMTGGNFFTPSLFSLGLGPWMIATIILRFAGIEKIVSKNKLPKKTIDYVRNVLMVVIAVFQAISFTARYNITPITFGPFSGSMNAQILVVVILVAGALAVAWLANRNKEQGIGDVTIFILYQIVITFVTNFSLISNLNLSSQDKMMLIVITVVCIIVVFVTIAIEKKDVRLHVNKISIDSGYTGMSYMPIKLNPAGAAPIMYGLALIAIPQYFAHTLSLIFPQLNTGASAFITSFTISSPVGFFSFLALLFGLSIFFGLFTVSPHIISEDMKKSGEYFDGISPGEDTRKYIRKQVVRVSTFSGVLFVIFIGLPLYFLQIDSNLSFYFLLPGTIMIFVNLVMVVQEEIADILLGTKYSPIFFE